MNKEIYTTAYISLIAQFTIGVICILGLFIKVDPSEVIVREMLIMDTIVQIIEFSFYVWLVYNFNNIKIDISVVRYYDWFFTTPTMLFLLICFFIYIYRKLNLISTEDLTLASIYNDNHLVINIVLIANALMLISGYSGEINILNKMPAFALSTFFLLVSYYFIYKHFIFNEDTNKYIFWFNFILWAGYGLAYMLEHKDKNNCFNFLDVFSKNIQGLLLVVVLAYYAYL